MKIVFSKSGDGLEAALDSRFGRAPKFLVFDTEKDAFDVVDNRQSQPTRVLNLVGPPAGA